MSTPTPDEGARPDFAVVVRGYDRAQVDAYVAHVLEWLADAQGRSELAERERDALSREAADLRAAVIALEERGVGPVPESLHAFSGRIGELMQRAMEAAHELETRAEEEARDRRSAAEDEARHLLDEARAEAERIVGHARDSERAVEEHVADLKAARTELLAGLDTLRDTLTEVLSRPEPAVGPAGDGAGPASDARVAAPAGPAGAGGGGDDVAGTPEPTIVQPAVASASGPPGPDAPPTVDAGDPTIVQPAVGDPGARTEKQPIIRRHR